MNRYMVIALLAIHTQSIAQDSPLLVFENLVGSTWTSEGRQLGGFDGKTSHQMEWGLGQKIVKTKTYTTDPTTKLFGLRNEGIRTFDVSIRELVFYEFDKLGGITTGVIKVEGENIHFEYKYEGVSLRDTWEYLSPNKYQVTVGIWEEDRWSKKFHEAVFERELP